MRRSKKKIIAREAKLRLTGQIMTECSVCNNFLPTGFHALYLGAVHCIKCLRKNSLIICEHCNEIISIDLQVSLKDRTICKNCSRLYYKQCWHCGQLHLSTDCQLINTRTVCSSCIKSYYISCYACGKIIEQSTACKVNDNHLCQDCFNVQYAFCASCDTACSRDDMECIDGDYYCPSCNPRERIRCCTYKPTPTFFGSEKDIFLGVELEIECYDTNRSIKAFDVSKEFYLKSDGSLSNGIEIVSHPCTLEYHQNNINWKDRCKNLISSGAKSHDTNTCGLHVHISSDKLSEIDRAKFSWFIHKEIDPIRVLCRRNFPYGDGYRAPLDVLNRIKSKCKGELSKCYKNTDRYDFLNWHNSHTVEFRLPKGTLKYSTLLATLEFCDAAIHYTLERSFSEIRQSDFYAFLDWCQSSKKNRKKYANLVNLYLEKDSKYIRPLRLRMSETALRNFSAKKDQVVPVVEPSNSPSQITV